MAHWLVGSLARWLTGSSAQRLLAHWPTGSPAAPLAGPGGGIAGGGGLRFWCCCEGEAGGLPVSRIILFRKWVVSGGIHISGVTFAGGDVPATRIIFVRSA